MSVTFLQNVPAWKTAYPSAKLYVEWAPGADLTDADGSGWSWTDISSDVIQSSGINVSPLGKSDSQGQTSPAGCSFTLDNRTGEYSRGPQSSKYPNVKLNTPIKVSISLDGTTPSKVIRFQGYAYSFKPAWDDTGTFATVAIQAAGVSRRLQNGTPALRSTMYRYYTKDAQAVAYWPMEEGDDSTFFAPAIGVQRMLYTNMNLAQNSEFTGSAGLPTFTATGTLDAHVNHAFAGNWEVDFLLHVPAAPGADTAVLRVHTYSSEVVRWEIVWRSTGAVQVVSYDNAGTGTSRVSAAVGTTGNVPLSVRFMAKQNGTGTTWQLVIFPADLSGSGLVVGSGTIATTTVGHITELTTLAAAGINGVTMGQMVVFDTYDHTNIDQNFIAWSGIINGSSSADDPYSRLLRLCTEENIDISIPVTTGTKLMGPQGQSSIMTLLRECEEVEQGILYDGVGPGFKFVSLLDIENATITALLTPNQLVAPFGPIDDDLTLVNKGTASRKNGVSSTYEQTTGTLGTSSIGDYEDQLGSLNLFYDENVSDYASWIVNQGQVEGYRYPQVSIDLRRLASFPSLPGNVLSLRPGARISISTIEQFVSQLPNGSIELLLVGYSEVISNQVWDMTLNCMPYIPFNAAQLDNVASSYTSTAAHLDTDNSTLSSNASLNATSISVATTGSILWTTTATDLGIYILVGGWRVLVSAISGTSSPQTFTISALPAAVSSGSQVKLWQPSYLGL